MRSAKFKSDRTSALKILRRTEQPAVVLFIVLGLAVLAAFVWLRRQPANRLLEIDHAPALQAEFKVDMNSAEWTEIVILPGIGENTARDIVAERERAGPFADLDELTRRVRGVGPKMIEEVQPFLLPITTPVSANDSGERN